jgi:menaquinone-9 beta-reductase
MSKTVHDVAIIGAGPAGVTAAIALARKNRRVLLLDRDTFPRSVICSGWVSIRAEKLLAELGVKTKPLFKEPIRHVTLYSADFSKSATPKLDGIAGYLVNRTEFDNALVEMAVEAGVTFKPRYSVANLQLKESSVLIEGENRKPEEARLLVVAAGRGTPLLQLIGRPRDVLGQAMWTTQASAQIDTGKSVIAEQDSGAAASTPRMGIVLGLDGAGSFGLCCVGRERVTVDANWMGEPEEAVPALVALCRRALEHHVIPVDLSREAAKAHVVRTPAAAALDIESHVRKHTLIIGDAGGFVSAVSNEGIFPAMWSAKIAAQVIDEALDSRHSQDTLMQFDSQWRMEIADHLRSPHTDIRFLLPLIFSNQPMADRMAAAFFFGENI